jgi:hypothetical protein
VAKFGTSACPLCSEWVPPSEEMIHPREFRRHLGRHLQQISLEALPLYIEGLVIQDSTDQGDTAVYKTGIPSNSGFAADLRILIDDDEVLILDSMFDHRTWHVRGLDSGRECLIESGAVKVTGEVEISLGKPSMYYSMNW